MLAGLGDRGGARFAAGGGVNRERTEPTGASGCLPVGCGYWLGRCDCAHVTLLPATLQYKVLSLFAVPLFPSRFF